MRTFEGGFGFDRRGCGAQSGGAQAPAGYFVLRGKNADGSYTDIRGQMAPASYVTLIGKAA